MKDMSTYIRSRPKKILNIYFTAGYPAIDDTATILESLDKADVDLIEIGIPFSDPLADGPTIQASNMKALDNGMTLSVLFEQLEQAPVQTPIILMGYLNPVLQYGLEPFLDRCNKVGVSGIILPDLPVELYVAKYKSLFEAHHVNNICLVSPETSEHRIRYIDQHCRGFIYAVSTSSTTGTGTLSNDPSEYLRGLKAMDLQNPILTGFNIKDKASFDAASQFTDGGIIGSAFINALTGSNSLESDITSFVTSIRS